MPPTESTRSYSLPTIPSPVVTIHYGPTTVKAPASFVFDTLTDVSTWPKWNVFVPRCDIISDPPKSTESDTSPGPSKSLETGMSILFHLTIGIPMKFRYIVNKVSRPDNATSSTPQQTQTPPSSANPSKYVVNWLKPPIQDDWIPKSIIRYERTHEVRILGEDICEVETWDCQAGPGAYFVKWLLLRRLERGFGEWVEGLRKFCEGEWGEGTGRRDE